MKKQEQVYVCAKCIYYIQHYVRLGERYVESYLGHCIHSRVKSRKHYAKACSRFEERLQQESAPNEQ